MIIIIDFIIIHNEIFEILFFSVKKFRKNSQIHIRSIMAIIITNFGVNMFRIFHKATSASFHPK